jgi:hypothetical protein
VVDRDPKSFPARGGAAVWADVSAVGIVDDNLDPPFMSELIAGLRDQLGDRDISVRSWIKPLGTAPAPASLLDDVRRHSQLAIAGIGL